MNSVFNFDPSEYNILIVDDVVANVLLLKVLLGNEHFGVLTASGGIEALDIAQKKKPDLILLDVMMPDLSGFEVAQKLSEDDETKEIPIIFLDSIWIILPILLKDSM
jgi:two-component system sensor histidine kinase/response regulator